jgi:hypothetical protein
VYYIQINLQTFIDPVVITSSSSSVATVHDEPWPLLQLLPAILKSFLTVKAFYGVGPSTPNLEVQGIPFCLDHHL